MKIATTPIESSQIAAIGYDAATQTLAIQFKAKAGPGSTYHYANVDAETYEAFRGAESAGRFFGQHIKPHADRFPFTKIVPEKDDDEKESGQ